MTEKEETATVALARELDLTMGGLYSRLAKHKIAARGLTLRQLIVKCDKAGMPIPDRVRAKVLGKAGNGHDTDEATPAPGADPQPKGGAGKRLYAVLERLYPLVERARARISQGKETDDDLELVKLSRFAMTGRDSESQE